MYAAGVWCDYDPTADPAHWATCSICGGTGRRDDPIGRAARAINPANTCNGCAGPGVALAHRATAPRPSGTVLTSPHTWQPQPGDIVAVPRILAAGWRFRPGAAPHALATPDAWQWLDQRSDGCLDPAMRHTLDRLGPTRRAESAVAAINARTAGDYLYPLPDGGQTLNPAD